MVFVERHPANPRMEGPLSRNHSKYCRKCFQLGTLLPLVRNIPYSQYSLLISIPKVTICSKNALPMRTSENHSQRPNTSYVLPKRVRTSQFKKFKEAFVLTRHSLAFYRCRDCHYHQPFVARPSANVYIAT